jgi:hypothetical protein
MASKHIYCAIIVVSIFIHMSATTRDHNLIIERLDRMEYNTNEVICEALEMELTK